MANLSEIISNAIKLHNTKASLKRIKKLRASKEYGSADFGAETERMLEKSHKELAQYFYNRGIAIDNTDVKAIYDSLDDEKDDGEE